MFVVPERIESNLRYFHSTSLCDTEPKKYRQWQYEGKKTSGYPFFHFDIFISICARYFIIFGVGFCRFAEDTSMFVIILYYLPFVSFFMLIHDTNKAPDTLAAKAKLNFSRANLWFAYIFFYWWWKFVAAKANGISTVKRTKLNAVIAAVVRNNII